jgi:hypothetical protein
MNHISLNREFFGRQQTAPLDDEYLLNARYRRQDVR